MVNQLLEFLKFSPEGKTPLRRSRRRWEDSIKMDLKNVKWENVNWIYLFRAMYNSAGCCEHNSYITGFYKMREFVTV
jgi:hypothetical protein